MRWGKIRTVRLRRCRLRMLSLSGMPQAEALISLYLTQVKVRILLQEILDRLFILRWGECAGRVQDHPTGCAASAPPG